MCLLKLPNKPFLSSLTIFESFVNLVFILIQLLVISVSFFPHFSSLHIYCSKELINKMLLPNRSTFYIFDLSQMFVEKSNQFSSIFEDLNIFILLNLHFINFLLTIIIKKTHSSANFSLKCNRFVSPFIFTIWQPQKNKNKKKPSKIFHEI